VPAAASYEAAPGTPPVNQSQVTGQYCRHFRAGHGAVLSRSPRRLQTRPKPWAGSVT